MENRRTSFGRARGGGRAFTVKQGAVTDRGNPKRSIELTILGRKTGVTLKKDPEDRHVGVDDTKVRKALKNSAEGSCIANLHSAYMSTLEGEGKTEGQNRTVLVCGKKRSTTIPVRWGETI